MKNKYGNYVIIKSLMTAEPEDKQLIIQGITRCIHSVNVTKYKNRWLQFIEENALKVSNLQPGQTTKPSLFKNHSQGGEGGDSSRKHSDPEPDSPPLQEDHNKAQSPSNINNVKREDKNSGYSQFYYQNKNPPSQDNTPSNRDKGGNHGSHGGHHGNGHKRNHNNGSHNNKNYSQKFYVEKSNNQNKGSYGSW